MANILDRLKAVNEKHAKRVDRSKSIAQRMKDQADAAKRAALPEESEEA